MLYLEQLFSRLPEFGWGDAKEWKGTVQDISWAVDALAFSASITLNARRAVYLQNLPEGEEKMHRRKWEESIKDEDSYVGHMLRNFPMDDGEFILHITLEELNYLAKKFLKYKNKKE